MTSLAEMRGGLSAALPTRQNAGMTTLLIAAYALIGAGYWFFMLVRTWPKRWCSDNKDPGWLEQLIMLFICLLFWPVGVVAHFAFGDDK